MSRTAKTKHCRRPIFAEINKNIISPFDRYLIPVYELPENRQFKSFTVNVSVDITVRTGNAKRAATVKKKNHFALKSGSYSYTTTTHTYLVCIDFFFVSINPH